jgi:hypothetical protein
VFLVKVCDAFVKRYIASEIWDKISKFDLTWNTQYTLTQWGTKLSQICCFHLLQQFGGDWHQLQISAKFESTVLSSAKISPNSWSFQTRSFFLNTSFHFGESVKLPFLDYYAKCRIHSVPHCTAWAKIISNWSVPSSCSSRRNDSSSKSCHLSAAKNNFRSSKADRVKNQKADWKIRKRFFCKL